LANIRLIRRRIKGVQSTMQITGAMEMVASSRIKRARERMEAAKPYADELFGVLKDLLGRVEKASHPLLYEHDRVKNVLILVLTADRGLCGAFNTNVIRLAEQVARKHEAQNIEVSYYVSGKKGLRYFRFKRHEVAASMTGISERPPFGEIYKISSYLIQKYTETQFDKVFLVFNRFISMAENRPTYQQLLPISFEAMGSERAKSGDLQFSYEPGPQEIFLHLLPNFISTTVYNAFLNSATSEISARRTAMKAATDNAENMIFELQKQYNKARQAQITKELSEIISSSEAISKYGR